MDESLRDFNPELAHFKAELIEIGLIEKCSPNTSVVSQKFLIEKARGPEGEVA